MLSEDIRNKNPISINKQKGSNKNLIQNDEISESEIFLMIII
jgi:hypothetical protein